MMRWFLLSLVFLVGCYASNDELRSKLENRAKFDMSCPNLQLVSLEETNGYTTTYGVTGCGRRFTYVLNSHTQSWILNADDGHAVSSVPPPPPPSN